MMARKPVTDMSADELRVDQLVHVLHIVAGSEATFEARDEARRLLDAAFTRWAQENEARDHA
jgi:hypothetical protein